MYFPHPSTSSGHSGAKPAADVPLERFHAAQRAGAMCLSADGRTAYRVQMGVVEQCFWNEEDGDFDSWWLLPNIDDFPAGAVRM